jgi:histone acetyltransferase (RNA polymerase elongator complex component)
MKSQKSLLFFAKVFIVMNMHKSHDISLIDEILTALISDDTIHTKDDFHRMKNMILAQYKKETAPSSIVLIARYQELVSTGVYPDIRRVRQVLRKRAVRSLSGVAVISLLTKFW